MARAKPRTTSQTVETGRELRSRSLQLLERSEKLLRDSERAHERALKALLATAHGEGRRSRGHPVGEDDGAPLKS